MATPLRKIGPTTQQGKQSQILMKEEHANELIFAVVGHVGSGTTAVADQLRALFINEQEGAKYDVHILKARGVMRQVLDDIMGLTKLNFNSCIYADGLPVTLRFADAIGEILTASLRVNAPPLPFRHYI